mgnify:CR=1 FL=1
MAKKRIKDLIKGCKNPEKLVEDFEKFFEEKDIVVADWQDIQLIPSSYEFMKLILESNSPQYLADALTFVQMVRKSEAVKIKLGIKRGREDQFCGVKIRDGVITASIGLTNDELANMLLQQS